MWIMRIIYIYKLIDPVTKDVRYVGKSTNPKIRLKNHISRRKNKYHSAVWINGLFLKGLRPTLEIIEECLESKWQERERYWISFYRDKFDLTNILDGGEECPTYDRTGKKWTNEQRINNRIARKGMKVLHTKEGDEKRRVGRLRYIQSNKKPVYQYSLDGEFLKKWNSASDAGKELGLCGSNITSACKKPGKIAGNFTWSHTNLDSLKHKLFIVTRKVIQKDLNGNILKKFDAIKDAADYTKILRASIGNCLSGRTKTSGGFIWEYDD